MKGKKKYIEKMTYLCVQFVSLKFTPKLTCFFFFLFLSSCENSYKFIFFPARALQSCSCSHRVTTTASLRRSLRETRDIIYIYIEREGLERRKNTTENYNDLLTHPPRQPALLLWIVHTIDIHKYVILLYKL